MFKCFRGSRTQDDDGTPKPKSTYEMIAQSVVPQPMMESFQTALAMSQMSLVRATSSNASVGSATLNEVIHEHTRRTTKDSDESQLDEIDKFYAEMLPSSEHLVASEAALFATFNRYENTIVVVASIVNFSALFSTMVDDIMAAAYINILFTMFDLIAKKWGATRVECGGGQYVCVVGMFAEGNTNIARRIHANRAMIVALEFRIASARLSAPSGGATRLTIGMAIGSVVAGFIGLTAPRFRLFGNAFDDAMEACARGHSGVINVRENCANAIAMRVTWGRSQSRPEFCILAPETTEETQQLVEKLKKYFT